MGVKKLAAQMGKFFKLNETTVTELHRLRINRAVMQPEQASRLQ
jgi:hypothetical protein